MQPIELLCEIAAQKGKVAALAYLRAPHFSALMGLGFLERAGLIQSVPCLNCTTAHDAEIIHHTGRNGYFCPEAGFFPVSEDEISAVRANVPKMVGALADAFECRARKSSPVLGESWRIGKVGSEAGDIAIYFQPTLGAEPDARELLAALAHEAGSTYRLILTAAGALSIAGAKTASLPEVVELDLSTGEVRAVADLRDLAGALRKNPGGAPNLYGQELTALIAQRISDGMALPGRNEEARAVLADFIQSNPNQRPPSLSSVKNYVSKARAGQ